MLDIVFTRTKMSKFPGRARLLIDTFVFSLHLFKSLSTSIFLASLIFDFCPYKDGTRGQSHSSARQWKACILQLAICIAMFSLLFVNLLKSKSRVCQNLQIAFTIFPRKAVDAKPESTLRRIEHHTGFSPFCKVGWVVSWKQN